jgi:hypothetical protein
MSSMYEGHNKLSLHRYSLATDYVRYWFCEIEYHCTMAPLNRFDLHVLLINGHPLYTNTHSHNNPIPNT